MAEETLKDRILETIDSLRRRKARPDLERICHMINRRHGVNVRDIELELERLVDAEVVIKVEYKGNTSYRNAAKWSKSHLSGNILNSNSDTRAILAAVESISEKKEPSPEANWGASFEKIEKFLIKQNADTILVQDKLRSALQREVDAGHILLDTFGFYSCFTNGPKRDIVRKFGRPLKRKRIRKTHGPDFEQEPLIKLSPGDQRCDYCSLPSSKNKYGEAEELLICKDCALKVHPSCMNYSIDLAERSRLSPWQCIDCKTCHVCNDAGDADTLLFCDACDKGYHMSCHKPELSEKPSGKWVCYLCEKEEEEMDLSSNQSGVGESNPVSDGDDSVPSVSVAYSPSLPSSSTSEPNTVQYEETSRKSSPEVAVPNQSQMANLPEQCARDSVIPQINGNPSRWNIEDVVGYFNSQGFKEHSSAFKDQEIDGQSLLLMKRNDVLTGLTIRLGPALKIYQHVSMLQLHRNSLEPGSSQEPEAAGV